MAKARQAERQRERETSSMAKARDARQACPSSVCSHASRKLMNTSKTESILRRATGEHSEWSEWSEYSECSECCCPRQSTTCHASEEAVMEAVIKAAIKAVMQAVMQAIVEATMQERRWRRKQSNGEPRSSKWSRGARELSSKPIILRRALPAVHQYGRERARVPTMSVE
jgi:hypothetical protein